MSRRDWGNGLAIGLIVGGGLAILLIVAVIGLNYCPGEPCTYTRFGLSEPPVAQSKPSEKVSEPEQPQDQAAEKPAIEPPRNGGNATGAEIGGGDHNSYGPKSADDQGAKSQHMGIYFPLLEDGAAQWVMAFFALVGVLVSAWAVLLVSRSLDATHLALGEAKAANSIAREIGEAQVRAYLSFETHRVNCQIVGQAATCVLIVKIYGASPAVNVNLAGALVVREKGWIWPSEEDEVTMVSQSTSHLPPNGTVHFQLTDEGTEITAEMQQMILADAMCIYGRGLCEYRDVFGRDRKTDFRFEFSGQNCVRTGKTRLSKTGNRMT